MMSNGTTNTYEDDVPYKIDDLHEIGCAIEDLSPGSDSGRLFSDLLHKSG
jgi:hypothetical protein